MKEYFNPRAMKTMYDLDELDNLLIEQEASIIYFSNESCNVCKVLKPKVIGMVGENYPRVTLIYIDTEKSPLISGQYRVFTIPTILTFFQGKEHSRFSRNINLYELEMSLKRPYNLIFGEAD